MLHVEHIGRDYSLVTDFTVNLSDWTAYVDGTVHGSDKTAASDGSRAYLLDAGHYVPRDFNMEIIHPRPDAGLKSYARQSNAYPGIEYKIPLSTLFGSFPFKWEIVTTPSVGGTVAVTEEFGTTASRNAGYGWLTWQVPSGASGDYTMTIRCYDQEFGRGSNPSSYAERTWTVNVNTSAFLFVAGAGSDANSGTLASPFQTADGWYKTSDTDATYVNKIVYYRTGAYAVDSWGVAASAQLQDTIKPMVHLQYPGEVASFDMTLARFLVTNPNDFYTDMKLTDTASQTYNNAMGFWFVGAGDRITCLGDIHNIGTGAVGNDNAAAYFFSNPGGSTQRQYITVRCNTITGVHTGQLFDMYKGLDVVIEDINYNGSSSTGSVSGVVLLKSDNQRCSVRNVKIPTWGNSSSRPLQAWGQEQNIEQDDIEIQYCFVNRNNAATPLEQLVALSGDWNNKVKPPSFSLPNRTVKFARNTIIGIFRHLDVLRDIYTDSNVIESDYSAPIQASLTYLVIINESVKANLIVASTDGAIDGDGYLQGAYISGNIGKIGHQIE